MMFLRFLLPLDYSREVLMSLGGGGGDRTWAAMRTHFGTEHYMIMAIWNSHFLVDKISTMILKCS